MEAYMSKKAFIIIPVVVCILAIGLVFGSFYKPVEVQSGKVVKCLDPKHKGNQVIQSSVKTHKVYRKDAGIYSIAVDSLVCAKCQERARIEEWKARARKQEEDAFIAVLREHDDAVLLYCRKIAGSAEADPYTSGHSIQRDLKRLRNLALSGKQLCAPESLGQVEFKYGKSMDELLIALPYIERGMKNNDMDAMQSGGLHMILSKQYRDEAISDIAGL